MKRGRGNGSDFLVVWSALLGGENVLELETVVVLHCECAKHH